MPRPHVARSTILLLTLALACALGAAAEQQPHTFATEIRQQVELDYLLYLPPEYDSQGDPWPLILFLHGAGERGDDVERVETHGPPKLIAAGRDFPAIVASPQCPGGSWWTDLQDGLFALLDDLVERYNVDQDRIYLTGLSMGGYGTWSLATAQPQRFAAAVPICGGGFRIRARNLRELPIWAFHGDVDPLVPLQESVDMVEAIRRAGGEKVRLTVYPDTGHDSWTAAYEDPALWEWLFSQRREP